MEATRRGTFEYADGRRVELEIGETRVKVEGIETTTSVLFGAEDAEPLLGAMTLEGLLLGVDPFNRRLVPIVGMLKSGPLWQACENVSNSVPRIPAQDALGEERPWPACSDHAQSFCWEPVRKGNCHDL